MDPMAAPCPPWLATHLQQAGGTVPFSTFMDLALNDPDHGYYGSGQVGIGPGGDFVTSPSLGPDFAGLLLPQLLTWLDALPLGSGRWSIVEIGPGEGHFAADLIQQLINTASDRLDRLELVLVESSPALCERQQRRLQGLNALPVRWCSLDDLIHQPVQGVVIAHELLDALPVDRVVLQKGELQLQMVGLDPGGGLCWRTQPLPANLAGHIRSFATGFGVPLPPQDAEDGWTTEWPSALPHWFEQMGCALEKGVLLVIDYALEAHRYFNARRSDGTLLAFRDQQAGFSPLEQPGAQDLTAHLCIETVDEAALGHGWQPLERMRQGEALLALGLAERLHGLQSLPGGRLDEALQRREALLRLVDPAGLGDFRWLTYGRGVPPEAFKLATPPGN